MLITSDNPLRFQNADVRLQSREISSIFLPIGWQEKMKHFKHKHLPPKGSKGRLLGWLPLKDSQLGGLLHLLGWQQSIIETTKQHV